MSFCLLDTNILLRVFDRNDPDYPAIRRLLADLLRERVELATASQCLREFWSVATRPAFARGGHGLPPKTAASRIRNLMRRVRVLSATDLTDALWLELVETHAMTGVAAHDAYIVAVMKSHGGKLIATLDGTDFLRFGDQIQTINPRRGIAAALNAD